MKKIIILPPFISPLAPDLIAKVEKASGDYDVVDYTQTDYTVDDLRSAEIIFGWSSKVEEALGQENQIKWIQVWMAGIDQLPLDKIAENGTYLTTASGANATIIAQQIMAMMLIQARRFDQKIANQSQHVWEFPEGMTEITNKKVLLLGTGNIGRVLTKYLTGFDMTVIGVNTTGHDVDFLSETHAIADYLDIVDEVDYLVNALPLTEATRNLIDADCFLAMSEDAFYINFGRGKTTDQDALVQALQDGEIAGAMLDVFADEPLDPKNPLWDMDNVIISPHSAGQSDYYNPRVIDIFLENFQEYTKNGQVNRNCVDYNKGY
ncbi:D-2-hydroxyacid dehydrogenase [Aerococcus kribbianus]|uniref:D-2-hydroxyacid dehydrogenase n=1 Tax=Aerococcus kribbianus TaxID=2999064 RepID=A0A9X3JDD5_9LACT|nr:MULTISPECIES: D-2-hydroxyacid dehydrogenase [unclassified Aerococcus]MCZ0717380.1 D-2-hydroxyacid dehydrogenase [Aerococcus sp. YH-aer221]MCZ0725668.1 D-2-hydroxyacid dehydrogenase [Aerococcus sp. YH-aer222]